MVNEQGVKEMRAGEEHITDLLPGYALNILTEGETTQAAEHLVSCPVCQAELRSYQATADKLPLALVQAAPRPALKGRLMQEVHSLHLKAARSSRPSFWQQWAVFLRRSAPAWGLALILVLALGNLFAWRRLTILSGRNTTPMRIVALVNTQASPQAVGALMINPSGEYGALVVDHLAMLDAGHQYQIWLKKDERRISGGVFSVNMEGYASVELYAPQPLIQYDTIGITIEPAGGSPGPTGAKVLGAAILP